MQETTIKECKKKNELLQKLHHQEIKRVYVFLLPDYKFDNKIWQLAIF